MAPGKVGTGQYVLTLDPSLPPPADVNIIPTYGASTVGFEVTVTIVLGIIRVHTTTPGQVLADRDFTIHVVDGTP